MKTPRGIRNNNPGNIRLSPTRWQGEVEGADDAFETFATPQDGVRAMCRILLTYYRKHGRRTTRAIIDRWAPPIENDTDAYVEAVAMKLGVRPDDEIAVDDPATLETLATAIIRHENGQQPYPRSVIWAGVQAALA